MKSMSGSFILLYFSDQLLELVNQDRVVPYLFKLIYDIALFGASFTFLKLARRFFKLAHRILL